MAAEIISGNKVGTSFSGGPLSFTVTKADNSTESFSFRANGTDPFTFLADINAQMFLKGFTLTPELSDASVGLNGAEYNLKLTALDPGITDITITAGAYGFTTADDIELREEQVSSIDGAFYGNFFDPEKESDLAAAGRQAGRLSYHDQNSINTFKDFFRGKFTLEAEANFDVDTESGDGACTTAGESMVDRGSCK